MRIAQVAPLNESVPPQEYGGIERVVSYLTEELVRQGHDVTLFASGDSVTAARLVPGAPHSLRADEDVQQLRVRETVMLEQVIRRGDAFDVVHFHLDYPHFPLVARASLAHVTTMHGRMDIPGVVDLFEQFDEAPLVSISDSQRRPVPHANWRATVYNALPKDLFHYRSEPEDYLAFVGRASADKGLDHAIEIAKRSGVPLRIEAKVGAGDEEYFESVIEPQLDHPLVTFVGEIGDDEKSEFLGRARAVVFPIEWPEPFGLVMIEAMATGTPVVAFREGAVPEVMADPRCGFVVTTVDEAVDAVAKLDRVDRAGCRAAFEERFTAERMARDYVRVYEERARVARPPEARV